MLEEPREAMSFDRNGRLYLRGSFILGKRGSKQIDQCIE